MIQSALPTNANGRSSKIDMRQRHTAHTAVIAANYTQNTIRHNQFNTTKYSNAMIYESQNSLNLFKSPRKESGIVCGIVGG